VSRDRNDIAQALWYVAPGRAEVREEVLLPPPTGSVCVRALHGALSRGLPMQHRSAGDQMILEPH
jgi:hypothetical protein